MPGPSRRCAFSAYNSTGIELINFSVSNYYYGQAEGLLISGSKNIVSHMNIKGSGDALNLRGSVYLTDIGTVPQRHQEMDSENISRILAECGRCVAGSGSCAAVDHSQGRSHDSR